MQTNNSNDDFTVVTGKRNHSSSSSTSTTGSPISTTTQQVNKKIKKLFKTANRFDILSQNDEPITNSTLSQNNVPNNERTNDVFKPPPPIFVRGVINYLEVCKEINELIGMDNFFCKASTDRLKIQTANPESYRALVHYLKDQDAQFHTYQLREDKPIRVVLRNLHPSTDVNIIKEELGLRMFEVRNVTNVLHKVTKNPLPLFFVDLEPSIKSKEIFQLSSFLHTRVKVEEPYKAKTISQCNNCQDYGHTKTYCSYPPRCVRCGDDHKSPDCPNQRTDPPKCALCSGNHPASYKGCSVYKDLQRAKKPNTKSNYVAINSKINSFNVKVSNPSNDTYPNQSHSCNSTYAQVTSGSHANSGSHSNNSVPPTTPDLNNMLTKFLDDFKSLINPLLSLLTKVIEKLLIK